MFFFTILTVSFYLAGFLFQSERLIVAVVCHSWLIAKKKFFCLFILAILIFLGECFWFLDWWKHFILKANRLIDCLFEAFFRCLFWLKRWRKKHSRNCLPANYLNIYETMFCFVVCSLGFFWGEKCLRCLDLHQTYLRTKWRLMIEWNEMNYFTVSHWWMIMQDFIFKRKYPNYFFD